jgi:hypothetical protein
MRQAGSKRPAPPWPPSDGCASNPDDCTRLSMPSIGPTTAFGVRRGKAALSSGCEAHPAIRSRRKQSEQSWR